MRAVAFPGTAPQSALERWVAVLYAVEAGPCLIRSHGLVKAVVVP